MIQSLRMRNPFFLVLLTGLAFTGCATGGGGGRGASGLADTGPALKFEEAYLRAKHLSQLQYQLWFNLDPAQPEFEGRAVVQFHLKKKAPLNQGDKVDELEDLFLDFEGGSLTSLTLNGKPISKLDKKSRYDGARIYFDAAELEDGLNRMEIAFKHPYAFGSGGLYRFLDPSDNRTYLYSNFEPFFAHTVFPCFDQPDLRGIFELTVEVPFDWQVVSNVRESEINKLEGRHSWAFPPSPSLSPHVFALHAGPYKVWGKQVVYQNNDMTLRLFARQSLARFVDAPEWFSVTEKGLETFTGQFSKSFPYDKYDQLIVPDLSGSAMENVSAVTFSESYVFKSSPTFAARRERAETILHELAHMWFGNLVALRWWNGLWLKESFATLAATEALAKQPAFPGAWEAFHRFYKQWAYSEDQSSVTHAIDLPIEDTNEAISHFNGITYGKGAAVLRQLKAFIGEDSFTDGLQRYFARFGERSATLNDLLKVLSEAYGRDLAGWKDVWLKDSGYNSVEVVASCGPSPRNPSKILLNSIQIKQSGTPLRPHQVTLSLLNWDSSGTILLPYDEVEATYFSKQTTLSNFKGMKCPDLVFVNGDDKDFIAWTLPEELITNARKIARGLQKQKPLFQLVYWSALWESVLDGKMSPETYIETAMTVLPNTQSLDLTAELIDHIMGVYPNELTAFKVLSGKAKSKMQAKLEPFFLGRYRASSGELAKIYFEAYLRTAQSDYSRGVILGLLNGGLKNQEQRWDALFALSRLGEPTLASLLEKERKRDPSTQGKRHAIQTLSASPDTTQKDGWISRMVSFEPQKETELASLGDLKSVLFGISLNGQESWLSHYRTTYFETLKRLMKTDLGADDDFIETFARVTFPSSCESKFASEVEAESESLKRFSPHLSRSLSLLAHDEALCAKLAKTAAKPTDQN